MKILKAISALLFLVLFIQGPLISQDIQFTDMANLPTPRSALTSASTDDFIFIVNGFGFDTEYTSEIYKYDIENDFWYFLTTETIPKRFASAEIIGDFLYIFNGVSDGILNNAVEQINILDGTISHLKDHPQASRAAGVCSWNDKIYSFGGALESGDYSDKLWEYNPADDSWKELSQIPFAGETKGEVIDGKLYILGGYNGSVSDQIDVYNLETNEWEANFTMPVGISAHATAVIGSKIYLVGDFTNLNSVAYFDTADNSFTVATSNLENRRHCAAEGVNGSLYALGGNVTSAIGSAISSVQKANIITSLSNPISFENIEVYPNPSSSIINLDFQLDEVKIYGINGKEVARFKDLNQIEIKDLNTGTYFLNGKKDNKMFISKFLKIED